MLKLAVGHSLISSGYLIGAKCSYFSSFCSSAAPTPLTLKEILNELSEVSAAKWYQLGIQLEIPAAALSTIESDHFRDAQRCMVEMLHWWLRNATECSWEKLTEAVEAMGGYGVLVEKLRKKASQGLDYVTHTLCMLT